MGRFTGGWRQENDGLRPDLPDARTIAFLKIKEQENGALPDMPEVVWLAEIIVGDFYDGRLDKASRNMARADAWASMPEVAAAERLRGSGASDRTLRLF